MSIKKFNREFESVSKDTITAEDEAHLHCSLGEMLVSMRNTDLNESSEEVPTLISNLHHVVLKVDTKSGIFWRSVEILEKIIETFQMKTETSTKLRLLPLLTDALIRSNSKIDYFLRMIEEITFGIAIKLSEPFLEQLIKYTVRIIVADKIKHDMKVRTIALSVLINLCCNNFASLSILNGEINIVDLQKKVSIDSYGFLSCKLILVLNDCGHLLRETDIRNYLKSTSNELQRIPSLDPHLLRHLVEFLDDIAKRPNTKDIFRKYDFQSGIMGAMMVLDSATEEPPTKQTDALFQIIQTVLKANNISLKKMLVTILNFAMKKLNSDDSHVEAIGTMTSIFNYDPKMSTSSFEFEEIQTSLKKLLERHVNDRENATILISIFKLLSVLAKCFRINLLSQNLVNTILSDILVEEDIEYFKINKTNITMYLQCINTLAVLNQHNLFSMKTNIFQKSNVQQLIGMAIKHGDTEQCNLALQVVGNTSTDSIAKIISCPSAKDIIDPEIQTIPKQFQTKAGSEPKISQDRIDELFKKIESSYADNIFDSNCTSQVIDLYSSELSWLKRCNEMLTNKVDALSKEITLKDRGLHRLDIVSTKWEDHWRNAEKTIQILMKDKAKLESMVANLSDKLKSEKVSNAGYASRLATEERKATELEKKVASLEEELNDIEELRLNVLNMMSKRKKGANKDNKS